MLAMKLFVQNYTDDDIWSISDTRDMTANNAKKKKQTGHCLQFEAHIT
jgi:hypothetical protein